LPIKHKKQPKSPLCHRHLLFHFLIYNLVIIFYPLMMLLQSCSSDISDIDLPIALRKGKRTCISHLLSKFISYSYLTSPYNVSIFFCELVLSFQVCVRSSFYPKMDRYHAWENDSSRIEWDVGPCFFSFRGASRWLSMGV